MAACLHIRLNSFYQMLMPIYTIKYIWFRNPKLLMIFIAFELQYSYLQLYWLLIFVD
jgi:hypothetical protein